MAVAAVMVVAIAAAVIVVATPVAVAVAAAVVLARVGPDASPRRGVRGCGVRLGKRWCSGQRTKLVSARRMPPAQRTIAIGDTKTRIRSAQQASWTKRHARRELQRGRCRALSNKRDMQYLE